jgi:hypothetical protein
MGNTRAVLILAIQRKFTIPGIQHRIQACLELELSGLHRRQAIKILLDKHTFMSFNHERRFDRLVPIGVWPIIKTYWNHRSH